MKKVAIGVVAVIVIIVLVMLLLPHLIDVNQYRGEIQAQLQNRLNRPVKLGAMSLAVFPLRVQVQDVTIGEDPRYRSNLPFADSRRDGHQRETVSAAEQDDRHRKPDAEAPED